MLCLLQVLSCNSALLREDLTSTPLTLHLGIAVVLIVMTSAQHKQSSKCVHLVPRTAERQGLEEIHMFELCNVKL